MNGDAPESTKTGVRRRVPTQLAAAFLEPLKKFCSRLQRRFLSSGDALATEHVRSDLRRSRNEARTQKDRSLSKSANGYRIFLNALTQSVKHFSRIEDAIWVQDAPQFA